MPPEARHRAVGVALGDAVPRYGPPAAGAGIPGTLGRVHGHRTGEFQGQHVVKGADKRGRRAVAAAVAERRLAGPRGNADHWGDPGRDRQNSPRPAIVPHEQIAGLHVLRHAEPSVRQQHRGIPAQALEIAVEQLQRVEKPHALRYVDRQLDALLDGKRVIRVVQILVQVALVHVLHENAELRLHDDPHHVNKVGVEHAAVDAHLPLEF
mmetsp:Transcript_21395/g.60250  ORF Transcript_21395/g.60250 Transcript_21395/m.60250 type:complete len:209 (-) Transcript_21395:1109-1735(-)